MKKMTKLIFKALISSLVVLPMFVSCYDDSAIWDKFDKIEHRLDSLENSLNEQFQALNSLIDSKTTIASCETNADGSYDVTLSNGIKFTVLPDGTKFSALVSVMKVGGVNCWATYVNGELTPLTDKSGNPVPVVKDEYRTQVEVAVEDGKYFLVIDGNKYMTGYDVEDMVQVFSSCEIHKDATGNIYAMTFTFGEGQKVTVAVDGYNGIIFKSANVAGAAKVLTEYYISYKDTQPVLIEMAGVVDYVMQIPDGWRVTERTDEYTGDIYFDITAPSAETVVNGAAVAEGDLKVVAVVEGGKAAVSKLRLSAEPFKKFDISGTKAVVEPYEGVQKYAYGLMEEDEFDRNALIAKVGELLSVTGDLPAGYAIVEEGINLMHSEILGSELDSETAYIFWAIPAHYREGDNAGYYVKDDVVYTYRLAPISVRISEPVTSLLDAEISVSIDGTDKIYAGTSLKSDDLFESIVYQINNGILEPVETTASFDGYASEFPNAESNANVEFLPGTTYVTWIVPVEEAKTSYSENDIFFEEFTTKSVTSGGSLTLEFGDATSDITSISIPVTSEGAQMIYYTYMPKTDGDRISGLDNDTKAELILEDDACKTVKSSSINAVAERVKPNTTMWLYAVAVDNEGKYGVVNQISASTSKLEYNSLTVTASATEIGSSTATFKVEVTGGNATEYIYWVGKVSDSFWSNSAYLGATRQNAQQYMACYPDDENIVKAMNKYGNISEAGTLEVDGLNMNTNYVFMVLAKDETGLYSKGGYKMITTLAADLGNVVRKDSDLWNTAKEQINIEWIKEKFEKAESQFLSSSYSFKFSGPTNLTAYIVSGSMTTFSNDPDILTIEDEMIAIENAASKYSEMGSTPWRTNENGEVELALQPDWYDDEGNPHGGYLLNIYSFNVHGYPQGGYVTYFAENSHGENNCNSWDKNSGKCSGYEKAYAKIEELRSLEYWTNYIKNFRGLTNEESIRKSGQAYYEAYYEYYKDAVPNVYVNDGKGVEITQPYAIGPDDSGYIADAVIIMLKDKEGNYYEPMYFSVPNYFTE